jgi:hypothetical protein
VHIGGCWGDFKLQRVIPVTTALCCFIVYWESPLPLWEPYNILVPQDFGVTARWLSGKQCSKVTHCRCS